MEGTIILRILAGIGAVVVAVFAMKALVEEWKKTGLDDQVTKVMMVLLTLGCLEALGVAFHLWGQGE
jgi:hypothetical protein